MRARRVRAVRVFFLSFAFSNCLDLISLQPFRIAATHAAVLSGSFSSLGLSFSYLAGTAKKDVHYSMREDPKHRVAQS